MKNLFITVLLAAASVSSAQTIPSPAVTSPAPDMIRTQSDLSRQLTPSAKRKVQRVAAVLVSRVNMGGDALPQNIRTDLISSFPGLKAEGGQIDALTLLVAMEAASQQEADQRTIAAEMQSMSQQKDALRAVLARAGKAQSAGRPARARLIPPSVIRTPPALPPNAPIALMQQRVDQLTEMSAMNQLRLQALTERRSKMLEIVSTMLQKMSTTESSILGKLK